MASKNIKDKSISKKFTTDECLKHKKKIDTFCISHDAICCPRCVSDEHKTCNQFVSIVDASKNVKTSEAFVECEDKLKAWLEDIAIIVKNRKHNIQSLKGEITQIEKQLNDTLKLTRKKGEHMIVIHKKVMSELQRIGQEEINKIQTVLKELKHREQTIQEAIDRILRVKKDTSDTYIFIVLKILQKELVIIESELADWSQKGSLAEVKLFLVNQTTDMENYQTFGHNIAQATTGSDLNLKCIQLKH